MGSQEEEKIHFTDLDSTDSNTDSDSDYLPGTNGVISQSIPSQSQNQNQNRNSSKYKGVTKRKSGNWGAQIRDRGVRIWLGTFPSEEEACQAYEKKKAQIAPPYQQCQLCQIAGQQCQSCQKAKGGATIRIKMGEEKEVTVTQNNKRSNTVTRPSPPVHPQSFVSKEKQREDITPDNPTSAAHVRTGSTSSLHNTNAKPPGFLEDLSSQLLKQMDTLTDAELKTGDFDSENDLISVNHLPLWTGNLDWENNSIL